MRPWRLELPRLRPINLYCSRCRKDNTAKFEKSFAEDWFLSVILGLSRGTQRLCFRIDNRLADSLSPPEPLQCERERNPTPDDHHQQTRPLMKDRSSFQDAGAQGVIQRSE